MPTLVDKPPVGPQWVHEIKWDGYRVSAYVADGRVTIRTRNGHDWTNRFPSIAAALAKLKVRSAVLDGEAVILDDRGRSSFAELQADLDQHGSRRAVLYAFDLLFLDGEDLRSKPLEARRELLGAIVPPRSGIAFSEAYSGSDLKAAFEEHATKSAHQVERLEEVFVTIDKAPRGAKTCEAMPGIMAEIEAELVLRPSRKSR